MTGDAPSTADRTSRNANFASSVICRHIPTMLIRSCLRILPAALFGLPAQPHAMQADTFRIDDGRAGRFEVGMPIDQVYLLFDRKQSRLVDLQLEGEFSPASRCLRPSLSCNRGSQGSGQWQT